MPWARLADRQAGFLTRLEAAEGCGRQVVRMHKGKPFSLSAEFLSVGIETKRWFLALALADLLEARASAVEARECSLIGETHMKHRAFELAALFYARPFQECLTPSGRTRLRLPVGLIDLVGPAYAAVHERIVARRDQLVAHRDLADSRLAFCVSSNHEGFEFGAILMRPAPARSDIDALIEIVDRLATVIKSELATLLTRNRRLAAPLFGTESTLIPSVDD